MFKLTQKSSKTKKKSDRKRKNTESNRIGIKTDSQKTKQNKLILLTPKKVKSKFSLTKNKGLVLKISSKDKIKYKGTFHSNSKWSLQNNVFLVEYQFYKDEYREAVI